MYYPYNVDNDFEKYKSLQYFDNQSSNFQYQIGPDQQSATSAGRQWREDW